MKNQSCITRHHLDSLYRIMLKRIAKGYTSQELSYLIGHETDYIDQVETLRLPFYTENEIMQITAALDENNAANLLVNAEDETMVNVAMTRQMQEFTLVTVYYAMNAEQELNQIFMLREDLQRIFERNEASDACDEVVVRLVETLTTTGFFHENKNALEVLEALKPLTSFEITPSMLRYALDANCDDDNNNGPLTKFVIDELNYGYEIV